MVDVYGMANVISISSPSAGRHYFTFSVFRMSLVSQAKIFFFLHDHYSYHKFLFLFSYIPPVYSPVLDIQQVFPFVFFSTDANSSSAGVLVNGESHLSVSPVIEVK